MSSSATATEHGYSATATEHGYSATATYLLGELFRIAPYILAVAQSSDTEQAIE